MAQATVIDKNGDIHIIGRSVTSAAAVSSFTDTIDLLVAGQSPIDLPDANYNIAIVITSQTQSTATVLAVSPVVTTKGTRTIVITFFLSTTLAAGVTETVVYDIHIYPTK